MRYVKPTVPKFKEITCTEASLSMCMSSMLMSMALSATAYAQTRVVNHRWCVRRSFQQIHSIDVSMHANVPPQLENQHIFTYI